MTNLQTVGQRQAQTDKARLEKISEGFTPAAAAAIASNKEMLSRKAQTRIPHSSTIEKDQSVMAKLES